MTDKPAMLNSTGWVPQPYDARDLPLRALLAAERVAGNEPPRIPKQADLRRFMPPVRNQLNLGSCVGHAVAAAMEFIDYRGPRTRGYREAGQYEELSELFIYYYARAMQGWQNEDTGAYIRDGVKVVSQIGAAPESTWPYDVGRFTEVPPAEARDAADRAKGTHYFAVNSLEDMKRSIAMRLPVIAGYTIFESGWNDEVDRTGHFPMPSPDEAAIGGHAVLFCFTGDTKISLMDGSERSLRELSMTHAKKDFWVYSCDERGDVVPGVAHSPRLTRKDAPVVKVTLDDGQFFRCTPDHRIMMRDGSYKEARHLSSGDSLMPLYKKLSEGRLTHLEAKRTMNHKVASVEPDGLEDVYDITVDQHHNFALTAGVFVHNCGFQDSRTILPKKGYEGGGRVWFRNSWGRDWGVEGHGTLSYDYVRQHVSDMWTIAKVENATMRTALAARLDSRKAFAAREAGTGA